MLPMAASGRRDKIVGAGFRSGGISKKRPQLRTAALCAGFPATRNKLYLRYLYRQLSREAVRCQCYDPV